MENKDLLKGIIIPNVTALVVTFLLQFLRRNSIMETIFISSMFTILPIIMGLISAYHWQKLNLGSKKKLKYSVYTCLILLVMSAFSIGEGYICLLIVSPLVYVCIITGVFIGKFIYEKKNNKLNMSIGTLLFVLFIGDAFSNHEHKRMITDEIIIHATPEKVWSHVVAFEPITEPPQYWLLQIGMPKPIATTVEGYYAGAGRKCIFNDGILFKEKMVVFDPGKDLTFDITEQPNDPEILGHIEITRGQFLLKANPDGTTTLQGNSWYSLLVFPSWYYDLWAESITRNVHIRVMEHVKYLSEKQ